MIKKFIITAIAAISMMVGLQAPASAAMAVTKPSVAPIEAASNIVKVGRRHGFRRFRHGGWRHHRWRRHYWHGHRWHYRRRYYGGRWAAYRRCRWKQRRGYRIRCYRPTSYYY